MTSPFNTRRQYFVFAAALLVLTAAPVWAGLQNGSQTVDGLTVYLGVVPAAISRGHAPAHVEAKMHGGPPPASLHDVHLVAAVFDASSGARRTDVRVMARIHGRGIKRRTVPLTLMTINGAKTFGGYTGLGSDEDVMISVDVIRPNRTPRTRTTTMQFQYTHD